MSDTPDPTLWPPPPLRPPGDVWEVERVRLVRTEGRLTVTNLAAKRGLWIGLLTACLPLPLTIGMTAIIAFAVTGGRRLRDDRVRHLLFHAFQSHFLRNEFIFITLALFVWSWFLYVRVMHRGLFVLYKQRGTFQRDGKDFYPLSQLQSILIKPAAQIGKNWNVALIRQGGDPRPR